MENYRKAIAQNDIDELHEALVYLKDLWGPHTVGGNKKLVIDNDNCTIWLQYKKSKEWRRYDDNPGVATFIRIIEKYVSEAYPDTDINFGRAYITRLKPGAEIGRHIDENDQPYFSLCNRYQLFLNIPANVTIDTGTLTSENTFFWFNHRDWHYYKNNGTDTLVFCVVDVVPAVED